MKVGDVVKVLKSCSGPGGMYAGSPPWKDELVEVTAKNIKEIEDLLRAGYMEMFTESKMVTKVYEAPVVLPDAKTRTRSRKRNLQSEDEA